MALERCNACIQEYYLSIASAEELEAAQPSIYQHTCGKDEWRPIPLQVPEEQQPEDNEADVHREPLPKKEGWNPPGPKYL